VTGIPATHEANGYTSQSPVAAGDRVWVLFGTGVAAAFDLKGTRLWARIAGRPTNGWGHSASPVLVDGKLILHIDRTVYALDPETGKELWTAPSASWWGTPFPVSVGGEWAVVTTGGDLVRCRDGKVVSSQIGGIPWTSPFAEGGVVYVVDENGAAAWKLPASLKDAVELERLWQTTVHRDRYYASPLLHEGLLYAMTQTSHMTVLEAATGKVVYERALNLGGTAYPSFCLAGGKVFASGESGKTVVFEPGREFREVAVNTLESFRSTPVFDGSRIYIRGLTHLWCLGAGE
jgi:outer membrane protein assembly factor BamB